MKTSHHSLLVVVLLLVTSISWAQNGSTIAEKPEATERAELHTITTPATEQSVLNGKATPTGKQKIVIVTGVRFAYPLVQKWIDDYNNENQEVQIVIESRGTSDPSQYDILIEAYEPSEEIKKNREYVYIARYAVLPVANSHSSFAKIYQDKGLDKNLIKQIFFHDLFADKDKEMNIKAPYTIYTRLQKAGAPITFTEYFGFEQKDIKGKAIAGSDEHLLKAVLRDSTGVTYLPLSSIYDHTTGKQLAGLTILPVDLNGNNRISDDEKFYGELSSVIQALEGKSIKEIHNIPLGYLNLSVAKRGASVEALTFLQWVINNGQNDLSTFGYLKPEPSRFEKEKFEQFASKRLN